jgi:hypothetical protein
LGEINQGELAGFHHEGEKNADFKNFPERGLLDV